MENHQNGEKNPLIDGEGKLEKVAVNNELCTQPRRTIIVEPLLVLYALAGTTLMSLKSQYMYQKIAMEMGINLNNLSSKSFFYLSVTELTFGYIYIYIYIASYA